MSGPRGRRRQRGQAMVEFAISSLVLIMVFTGIMDIAFLFAGHVATHNAVRAAARYAAANPRAWSNTDPPAANSIQNNLKVLAVPAIIHNTDAYVTIKYTVPGAGSGTVCGQYSAASNAFVPAAGTDWTDATCIVPGHLVTVQATWIYNFMTPLLKGPFGSVTMFTEAAELEET